ncbi:MAG: 4Fe-4S binding protein [Chloroflexi bacterium]|jgi:polyferredoxin|nr:4Fe-4S binding protein [Chloroflexota bacterium]
MTTSETTKTKQNDLSKVRRWMQAIFVAITFLLGLRHILPGEGSRGGAFDAFCPFGGIETLWGYIATGHTLKTTSLMNFTFLIAVLGLSLVAGRAFCGWVCPLGTLQDMFAGWARRLSGETNRRRGKQSQARFPLQVPPKLDQWLRYLKYLILAAILIASTMAVYPPLHSICPALAIFSFKWSTPLLGAVLAVFILTSMLVKRFSCKYLCPLGAALAIFNKISPIHIATNSGGCNNCGRCEAECPVDIPAIPENLRSAECIRCLECIETCARPDAIELHLG